MKTAGLFAGVGGIELGLEKAGWSTELLCELDESARRVLSAGFPGVPLVEDVRRLRSLPKVDLVAAGFPCQDLSQAGGTAGITGRQSGLVEEVFRLVGGRRAPTWLLIENVSFMLHLDSGRAMHYLTERLADLGFAWAYRVVDTRAFGLPQRRQRVIMLASKKEDPAPVLLSQDAKSNEQFDPSDKACSFYWTEGLRGLGWAVDAVPTLKGGSTVGIPSPPAVWLPDGSIKTPEIRDAERLQGFVADWTAPAVDNPAKKNGPRWRLVGNAVSVPVANWVGRRIAHGASGSISGGRPIELGSPWPKAAHGSRGLAYEVEVGMWPERRPYRHLDQFLRYPMSHLSRRALSGFLSRASRSNLRFPEGLLEAAFVALNEGELEAAVA